MKTTTILRYNSCRSSIDPNERRKGITESGRSQSEYLHPDRRFGSGKHNHRRKTKNANKLGKTA